MSSGLCFSLLILFVDVFVHIGSSICETAQKVLMLRTLGDKQEPVVTESIFILHLFRSTVTADLIFKFKAQ